MLAPLEIPAGKDTPEVRFDPEQRTFRIVGSSYPENAAKFYVPILAWLEDFKQQVSKDDGEYTFEFHFEYFNTSSSKFILQILQRIQQIASEKGVPIRMRWYYYEDDPDIEEAGYTYNLNLETPMELIAKPPEEDEDEDISYLLSG